MEFGSSVGTRPSTIRVDGSIGGTVDAATYPTTAARLRDGLAVRVARAVVPAIRLARAGEGSSLPGVVAERLSPRFLERRASRLTNGVVVVSGTNGKTTTASMIREILRAAGVAVIGNETGSNLRQGVVTTLVRSSPDAQMAVLEVDEAALATVVPAVRPRILVLTNVFRDQLDRFGETERVTEMLRAAGLLLPENAAIVANADDPFLWHAIADLDPIGFGVRTTARADSVASGPRPLSTEPEACPNCGERLTYELRTIVHLGVVRCDGCNLRSAAPSMVARVLARRGLSSIDLEVAGVGFTLSTGGVHNAYNAAAAIATADLLGIHPARANHALRSLRPRFGRAEKLELDGRPFLLALLKNPGGAAALLDEISEDPTIGALVVSVNDEAADGRDISWIWDVEFERLVSDLPPVPSGSRADDVALRLLYAGARPAPACVDPLAAIRAALAASPTHRMPVVLATYTAMLGVRAALVGRTVRLQDVSS